MGIFDRFRNRDEEVLIQEESLIEEEKPKERIEEVLITKDNSRNSLINGEITSIRTIIPINEDTLSYSPSSLSKMLTSGDNSLIGQIIGSMSSDLGLNEIFLENEEMD